MKLEFEGMDDESIKPEFILASFKDKNDPENTRSIIAGSYDDIGDIITLLECTAVSAFQAALKLDKNKESAIKNSKVLLNLIDIYSEVFDKLKANVFMELFYDILKEVVDRGDANLALDLSKIISKINKDMNIKIIEIGRKEINEIKRKAMEVFDADSIDDIHVDIQELLKQMGDNL